MEVEADPPLAGRWTRPARWSESWRRPTWRVTHRARKQASSSATCPSHGNATNTNYRLLRRPRRLSSGRPGVSPFAQISAAAGGTSARPPGRPPAAAAAAAPARRAEPVRLLRHRRLELLQRAPGCFSSSSISPSSSRAGASGPGVTADFSVASSRSAAARIAASASAVRALGQREPRGRAELAGSSTCSAQ